MDFIKLEKLMEENGVNSLAQIARILKTSPQAVSNWKSRNQVPSHVVLNIDKYLPQESAYPLQNKPTSSEKEQNISDFLIIIAEQIKLILLIIFCSVFFSFTYVQYLVDSKYETTATILLPEKQNSQNFGSIAALAGQFGVNLPMASNVDLSSPSLYPELLRSRKFAEKILSKEFFIEKLDSKMPLIDILTLNKKNHRSTLDENILIATEILNKNVIQFNQDPKSTFSTIRIAAMEPALAKELAEVVIEELEELNRFFKSKTVNEKTAFINNRINNVKSDLEKSEDKLKFFNENNRQISSPALQLEQERLEHDVEIQKGVFLTLKQQYELAKIEAVQEASLIQVLDKPYLPLKPFNKNLKLTLILSIIFGSGLSLFVAFIRSFIINSNIEQRKKNRRIKFFINKKGKDLFNDPRIFGFISCILILFSPLYFSYKSSQPEYFGMYSNKIMLINLAYFLTMIVSLTIFITTLKKRSKEKRAEQSKS